MKKILLITNYFYPEYASLGQLMTDLSLGLADDFKISVIAMIPGYTDDVREKYKTLYPQKINFERWNQIDIYRVFVHPVDKSKKSSRVIHILSYFWYALGAILRTGSPDVVFCVSQPPVLGGLLGLLAKIMHRSKLIYNIQDFNPEQIEAVQYSRKPWIINLLRLLDNLTLRAATAIVLVGEEQKETLQRRGLKALMPKVHVVHNWINQQEIIPLSPDTPQIQQFKTSNGLQNKRVIMYSGNLGLFYDLENLIRVMETFKDDARVVFALVGDGALKTRLVQYCTEKALKNIVFIPYQKKDELIFSLNCADIHLVANLKQIKGISVPSKLYGVMATAKPILGVVEAGSEAQKIISESGCGLIVPPGNYGEIEKAIRTFLEMPEDALIRLGTNGRAYLEKHLTMENAIAHYGEIFRGL